MNEPKVIYVKTWRDIPQGAYGVNAVTLPSGEIYAVKGKATKSDIEHEKAHISLDDCAHRAERSPQSGR